MAKVTVIISAERGATTQIEIDSESAGLIANGAYSEHELLYDGRGNLINSNNETAAEDLVRIAEALKAAKRSS